LKIQNFSYCSKKIPSKSSREDFSPPPTWECLPCTPIGLSQKKTPSYLSEVMDFFRPEFSNRIDSVVSFSPLLPDHIRAIAALELQALSRRDGLQRPGARNPRAIPSELRDISLSSSLIR
jgi:hypothetical protein